MPSVKRFGSLAILIPLLGLAVWFRVTSLEALPVPDPDESWFADQFAHIAHGERFEIRTPSDNLLNPLRVPLDLPFHWAFPPSLWIARASSTIAGLLSLILLYTLSSRLFDRTTGLIATTLLAVLPFAIIHSRTGYDCSQTPIYSVLLIYFTHRRKLLGILLSLIALYFAHPTNIFVVPLVMVLLAARCLVPDGELSPGGWRELIRKGALIGLLAGGLGWLTVSQPKTQQGFATFQLGPMGRHDLWHFWARFGRLFLATGEPRPWHDRAFWAVVLPVALLGVHRLTLRRRWDRLALVAGTCLSALALFVVGGSDILQPGITRYGWCLIVPSVIAFACLLEGLLIVPSARPPLPFRRVQLLAMAGVAWALLLSFDLTRIDDLKCVGDGPGGGVRESIWTFGVDARDPGLETFDRIVRAIRDDGPSEGFENLVLCESWGVYYPSKYLARDRRDLDVQRTEGSALPAGFEQRMRAGALLVARPDGWLAHYLDALYPSRAFRREEVRVDGKPFVVLYRWDRDTRLVRPASADYDGDGRADLAVYRPDDATWHIRPSTGGEEIVTHFGPPHAVPVPGDYDGDGRADLAVYRPDDATWHIRASSNGLEISGAFGPPHAVPIPGDYDGDGRADLATYFHATAHWQLYQSSSGLRDTSLGAPTSDRPAPADYDGDGRVDLAVYRPESGTWYLALKGAPRAVGLGGPGHARPAPADYDGDGKADPALFLPDAGRWNIQPSAGGADALSLLGDPGDATIPADYDGDGKADLAAFQPAKNGWEIRLSGGSTLSAGFKIDDDHAPAGGTAARPRRAGLRR